VSFFHNPVIYPSLSAHFDGSNLYVVDKLTDDDPAESSLPRDFPNPLSIYRGRVAYVFGVKAYHFYQARGFTFKPKISWAHCSMVLSSGSVATVDPISSSYSIWTSSREYSSPAQLILAFPVGV
jgi:hypothetical protein